MTRLARFLILSISVVLIASMAVVRADDGDVMAPQDATTADLAEVLRFDQMLDPIPARGSARRPLKVAGSWIGGGGNWFATKAVAKGQADCVSLYARQDDDTWRLRWRVRAPYWLDKDSEVVSGWMADPVFFSARVQAHDGRSPATRRFVYLSKCHQGTGGFREDFIFLLTDRGEAVPVAFEPAAVGYQRLSEAGVAGADLGPGEGIWKPGTVDFAVSPPTFGFAIWRDGDANCCPTAGRVTGTLAVRVDAAGTIRVGIDTWRRGPVEKD